MCAFRRISLGIAGFALAAGLLAAHPAGADEKESDVVLEKLLQINLAVEANMGGLWIGIAAEPAEKGGGLLVEHVLPESPAAKAGLQKGDVIMALRGKPLSKIEDLQKAVAESNGESLSLQVTRDGKSHEIAVKPEKQSGRIFAIVEGEKEAGGEEGRDAKKPKAPTPVGNPAPRFQPNPGQPGAPAGGLGWVPVPGQPGTPAQAMAFMGGSMHPMPPLPDDMEVTVTKKGNRPAVIKVTQGVKGWKTDENELGMLPPQAQVYAARLLGRPQMVPGMMPPMMGGGSWSGAVGGGPLQFQIEHGKDGKLESKPPATIAPKVRQLPGGGLQIEIREAEEKVKARPKTEGKPGIKKPEPKDAEGKSLPENPQKVKE